MHMGINIILLEPESNPYLLHSGLMCQPLHYHRSNTLYIAYVYIYTHTYTHIYAHAYLYTHIDIHSRLYAQAGQLAGGEAALYPDSQPHLSWRQALILFGFMLSASSCISQVAPL